MADHGNGLKSPSFHLLIAFHHSCVPLTNSQTEYSSATRSAEMLTISGIPGMTASHCLSDNTTRSNEQHPGSISVTDVEPEDLDEVQRRPGL